MATKMPRKLVALSFAAIATIYSTGYLATQGADSRIALSESATVASVAATAVTAVPTLVPAPIAPAASVRGMPTPIAVSPATPTARTSAPVATTGYRDGTYEGQGTSRRGGFRVAVTIQSGAITNVAFTQVTTQYPVSRVAGLPAQVVARQSAQVDRVSGATFSTQAFQQAVQQALALAGTTGGSASVPAATANGTAG
jgi:uncharacterized protein with FMN-binding domain